MNTRRTRRWISIVLLVGAAVWAGPRAAGPARAETPKIGVNVLLRTPPSAEVLADLGRYGAVLDVLPQIGGVTLRTDAAELPAIRALPCVADAYVDAEVHSMGTTGLPVADLSAGADCWNLDAVDVTDFGAGRTVGRDGAGVYVAVIDSGLPHNWRSYFPEERIATQLARAFAGGGGDAHVVSSQPERWEQSTNTHMCMIVSVLLGFAYQGPDATLPRYFNGVAPKVTVIPIVWGDDSGDERRFESAVTRCILYAADLRAGPLAGAPLVINLSNGGHQPLPMERAAIAYAITNGAIVVAAAGNEGDAGMVYPAAYPEVISVAATGWTRQFPSDDSSTCRWVLRNVSESDVSEHYVAPFSSRALAGQELDVAAPGAWLPVAVRFNGKDEYAFAIGTSHAAPHVAGIAALLLEKNPNLAQAQVESILRSTARPLPAGSATVRWGSGGPGDAATWADHGNVSFFDLTTTWSADATGAGLVQADAALAATPNP